LQALRARRDNEAVRRALERLKQAAAMTPEEGRDGKISAANTMPYILDAVRAYATVARSVRRCERFYGSYVESSIT